jgi:hypothetical protein
MPYVVTIGELHRDGVVYKVGDVVPTMKGALAQQVAIGVVEWQTPEKPEPAVSAAASRLSEEKVHNEEASEAGRVLESARKKTAAKVTRTRRARKAVK